MIGAFIGWAFAAGGLLLGLFGIFGAVRHFRDRPRMTPK